MSRVLSSLAVTDGNCITSALIKISPWLTRELFFSSFAEFVVGAVLQAACHLENDVSRAVVITKVVKGNRANVCISRHRVTEPR
jgi:hypothetical protein